MRAAAGVLAVAAGDCAGGALGPVVAGDAQPARRAIMMRDAASTGISPIRQARCRAPQGIGGEWRVTGVSLEGPGCLLQQTCALASALLAYVRLRVIGCGGRLRSRAPAARPFAGWRSSSPLRSGGAGTTGSGAVRGRTRRPTCPAAACGRGRQSRGRGSPWLRYPVRAGGVGVAGLVWEDSWALWSPWWRGRANCLVPEADELSGAGIAAGSTVAGG